MTTRVFVYGTLMSGCGNDRLMTDPRYRPEGGEARLVGPALTRPEFTMYSCYGGGYPALVRTGGTAIVGEVWEVNDAVLERLDRLEGVPHHYQRIEVPLAVPEGAAPAHVYVQPAKHWEGREADVIASGAWRAFLTEREERLRREWAEQDAADAEHHAKFPKGCDDEECEVCASSVVGWEERWAEADDAEEG